MQNQKVKQFLRAVESMRYAQKAYFKHRTKEHLIDAKQQETAVDKLVTELKQGSIF